MARLSALIGSLWFRVTTAFVVILMIMSFFTLRAIDTVTEREFELYVLDRSVAIQDTLVELFPHTTLATPVPARPVPTVIPPSEGGAMAWLADEPHATVIEVPPISGHNMAQTLAEAVVPSRTDAASLRFLGEVRQGVQMALLIAGVAAVLLGTLLVRQITRPLSQLQRAAYALAQGNLGVRVPVAGQDEVGRVATAFNQMATELEKQEQVRRQMVADVAHELRTPVSVIRANLEAMLDGLIEPTNAELGELNDEIQRLTRLIDDLRLLSLADAHQLSLNLAPADAHDIVATAVARMTPLAEARAITLEQQNGVQPVMIEADADKLLQALGNLVDNALRHTPAGGRVVVSAVHDRTTAYLSVADTGPGIPPEDLPYLFDRFWRGDKSRSRHNGGTGLGLSIVKQVTELHGGRVTAVSPAGGTVFTISLPLADNGSGK